jgi:hypothetical protein
VTTQLPPKPDFQAIEAAAHGSADRRTMILALIGNLIFSWSNNESMFIYVIMLLMRTDEGSAAIVFTTLNTTRARLDLIQRLAKAKLAHKPTARALDKIIDRFNACSRVRNEFNHCMYTLNERGEITATHSLRIHEEAGGLRLGTIRPMDDARISELTATITELKKLNRDIWEFLPKLEQQMTPTKRAAGASRASPQS